MHRRAVLLALPWLAALPRGVAGQSVDPDLVRAWDAAQRDRPARLDATARIAAADEPGTPLVIQARLVGADGTTPVAGAVVFAYQTDATGVYNRPGLRGWRLQGWARTSTSGTFTFRTIRPAPYPGRRIAAHVHLGVDGPAGERHLLPDLLFTGDPLLTIAEREASARRGAFANVRPVHTEADGNQRVEIDFRLPGDHRF